MFLIEVLNYTLTQLNIISRIILIGGKIPLTHLKREKVGVTYFVIENSILIHIVENCLPERVFYEISSPNGPAYKLVNGTNYFLLPRCYRKISLNKSLNVSCSKNGGVKVFYRLPI